MKTKSIEIFTYIMRKKYKIEVFYDNHKFQKIVFHKYLNKQYSNKRIYYLDYFIDNISQTLDIIIPEIKQTLKTNKYPFFNKFKELWEIKKSTNKISIFSRFENKKMFYFDICVGSDLPIIQLSKLKEVRKLKKIFNKIKLDFDLNKIKI